jgi:exonuclease III
VFHVSRQQAMVMLLLVSLPGAEAVGDVSQYLSPLAAGVVAGKVGKEVQGWTGNCFSSPRSGKSKKSFLRIAEYNVAKSLSGKVPEVVMEMERDGIDIMVLTETGLLGHQVVLPMEGYTFHRCHATNDGVLRGGIMIIVRERYQLVVDEVEMDREDGRWLRVLLCIGGPDRMWVCGGYGVSGPSLKSNQVAARDCVETWCQQIRECRKKTDLIVWASDSNFIRDSSVDRRIGQGGSRVANNKFDASEGLYASFVDGSGLSDSWCQVHGAAVGCTRTEWSGARGEVSNQSRIDHIFLSEKLAGACIGVGVQDGGGGCVFRSLHDCCRDLHA